MEDIDAADQKYGLMQLQRIDCQQTRAPHLTHLKALSGPWNISEEGHQNKDKALENTLTSSKAERKMKNLTVRVHQIAASKSVKANRMS